MTADVTPTARTAAEKMQATRADATAPSLTPEWSEALRKASAARMTPTVTRTAAIAGTIASRDRRVRTSQLFWAP